WFIRLHAIRRSRSGLRLRPSRHSLRLVATLYMLFFGLFALGIGTNLIIKPFREQIVLFMKHKEEYTARYNQVVPKDVRDKIDEKFNDEDFQQRVQDTLLPVAA